MMLKRLLTILTAASLFRYLLFLLTRSEGTQESYDHYSNNINGSSTLAPPETRRTGLAVCQAVAWVKEVAARLRRICS